MKKIMSLIILMLLSGCATFQGGMPTPPFDIEKDLGELKSVLKSSMSVTTYYNSPSVESRNKFISSRLVLINIEYIKYIKDLTAEESQIHAATDILVLSLDIASTAFTPVNTKTTLSAISSGVGGTRLSIDQNFYHKKTVPVLISSMNAERKSVLSKIIQGLSTDLNGYPFEQALSDINDYFMAGTIQGALNAIQRDSGAKENKAQKDIQTFLKERKSGFVDKATQSRVNQLLDEVDNLEASKLFDLNKNPPVSDAWIEQVVKMRDPYNKRETDKDTAIKIIKMRIVLSERDENALRAWEAAIKSESK
jgi:hypothetical protein